MGQERMMSASSTRRSSNHTLLYLHQMQLEYRGLDTLNNKTHTIRRPTASLHRPREGMPLRQGMIQRSTLSNQVNRVKQVNKSTPTTATLPSKTLISLQGHKAPTPRHQPTRMHHQGGMQGGRMRM